MIGLVMAGGLGTRMRERGEKLVLGSRPLVLRVIDAMIDSNLYDRITVATSKNSPRARKIIKNEQNIEIIETSGDGYVGDMADALRTLDGDVMIVPGDLALLDGQILRDAFAMRTDNDAWTVIMTTAKFAESLGATPSYFVNVGDISCTYTGVSIVNAVHSQNTGHVREDFKILDDKRIALNVNTPSDYKLSLESFTEP